MKIIVESMVHLKELSNVEGYGEFFIRLNSGVRSLKRIRYFPEGNEFVIHHEIDDTWDECVTEEELQKLTNIPEAIEKGALFFEGHDLCE